MVAAARLALASSCFQGTRVDCFPLATNKWWAWKDLHPLLPGKSRMLYLLSYRPEKLEEGGGIEPLGRNAHPGFQNQLPAIQRHLPW